MNKKGLLLFVIFAFSFLSLLNNQLSDVEAASENEGSTIGTYTFNWQMFWRRLNRFVDWTTEWYNGDSWVNRDSSMQIIRDYPEPNKVKITLNFTSQEAGDYRFTLAINRKLKNHINKTANWQYELSYRGFTLVFDWSDLKDISGLILSHGVLDNVFWFRIKRNGVPANYNLELDPSIVGTDTYSHATGSSFQRKVFYAEGRFWVFYCNETYIVYKTSTDAETWSAKTDIGRVDFAEDFSLWFNGTHVAYALMDWDTYEKILFRMGEPQSDGTINWSAAEQEVQVATYVATLPFVSIDSEGYPWISYIHWKGASILNATVTKSSTNDGTWVNATGFPQYLMNHTTSLDCQHSIIPLSSGKMYVVYKNFSAGLPDRIVGRLWNGTAFESEENINCGTYAYTTFSVVSFEDDVHIVANICASIWNITYNKRTYGVGWGNSELVQYGVGEYEFPVLSIDDSSGRLCVYYADSSSPYRKIFYKLNIDGVWDTDPTLLLEEDVLIERTSLSVSYEGVGLIYTIQSISPYTVKFSQGANIYTFHGLYNEETGLFDPSAVNVTVYFNEGNPTETFEVNGTYVYRVMSIPLYFHFDLQHEEDVVSQYGLNILIYNGSNYYDILFPQYEEDTNYSVEVNLTWNSTYTVTNKEETGCRINFGTSPTEGDEYMAWYVYRSSEGVSNDREYWLGSTETSATIYIFDATFTLYTITFLDLAGVLDDYPLIPISRLINSSLFIVEKRKVDIQGKIQANLIEGEKYTIVVQNGASYTFGDLLFTSDRTITLTLKGVEFPYDVILSYRYVRVYTERHNNLSSISVLFEETQSRSCSVEIDILYENLTSLGGVYPYSYGSTTAFNHTWASANFSLTYVVQVEITHPNYGIMNYNQILAHGFYVSPPWNFPLGTIPNFNTAHIIPIILIIACFLIFSRINAYIAPFLATSVAILLTWWNWIPIPPIALMASMVFSILLAFTYKKKRYP